MFKVILILLLGCWFLGYIHFPLMGYVLFTIGSYAFTIYTLLMLMFIGYLISLLPGFMRMIAIALFVLWFISTIGPFLFSGLSTIIFFILIIFIFFAIF